MNAQTEQQFIQWMADFLHGSTNTADMSYTYAREIYLNFIEDEAIKFGDEGYLWDEDAAQKLVDTNFSYWQY